MSRNSFKHNKVTRILFKPLKLMVKTISPTLYVKFEYQYITGHKLNLKNPKLYTEKLQFLRLYSYPNNQLVKECTSHEGGKTYVSKLGFNSLLVKSYGTYSSFDEIDFSSLPNQFVIKCNHGSGMVYVCYDKNTFNYKKAKRDFMKWLKIDYGKKTIEPHYSGSKRFIIIEELLLEDNNLPIEYKIHCFNGVAKYFYVVTNRAKDIHYNNYYIDWRTFDDAQFNNWTNSPLSIKKPDNFDQMVKIAETLSKPFPFVRIDLYNINGKIYFSELTFTPAKGTLKFHDINTDLEIGEWLTITK